MITRRLRLLTLAGIVLMVLHGVEEWMSGFFSVDPSFEFVAGLVSSKEEALFLAFQATWWLLLILFGLLTFSAKWRLRGLGLFGAVMVFEWMHLIPSFRSRAYFPGAITSLLFVPLSIAFWMEFRRAHRCTAVCPVCSRPVAADRSGTVSEPRLVHLCSAACRDRLGGLVP
jgi:hypothetical protein